MALKILRRDACPLGGNGPTETLLELPYTSPLLGKPLLDVPGMDTSLTYALKYSPQFDFYWQPAIVDSASLPQNTLEQSHYTPPDLPRFAHLTEEALLFCLLLKTREAKVFDLGLGEGWWLKMMAAYGMEPHGYDVCQHSRTVAERSGFTFRELDKYPDGYFDLINATEVFEHLPDPVGMAKVVSAKLKKGGIFKLSTPGDKKIRKKISALKTGQIKDAKSFNKLMGSVEPLQHINLFSAKALRAMAAQAGLQALKIPFWRFLQASVGPFSWRQLNRLFYHPLKASAAYGTLQYFVKP